MCLVIGCTREVVAKGLCDTHYRRNKRHGTTEQTRPKDWGSREKHPLYGTWSWFKRSYKTGLSEEWLDFWKFLFDIGDRPENSVLKPVDKNKPLSKTNFMWVKKVLTTKSDGGKNAYHRAHRIMNPDSYRNSDLKKSFGITLNEYNQKLKEQYGHCAICGKEETKVDNRTKLVRNLAVDHNHSTNEVRGLLCMGCNQGIGNFKEDTQRLKNAVQYLEKHNGI